MLDLKFKRPKIRAYQPGDAYKYVHLKRDGIYILLTSGRALTRHPDGEHDIMSSITSLIPPLISEDSLMCELYAPGEDASQVKRHIANKDMSRLQLECFAVPSLPADTTLEECKKHSQELGIRFVPFKTWLDHECDTDGHIFHVPDDSDIEGYVFKDGNLLNWARWKPVLTTDLIIIGFTDGCGKYLGEVGAILCQLHNRPQLYRVSGFDNDLRWDMSIHPELYIGRVVEVAYQRVESNGGLRHPRFKRFRDDKTPEECIEL